ncbi:hypothetical protein MNB_SV-12-1700 [hydrothermal vent metagenome]|uniref:Uncharacterized protein n=1 Tax=hydrothermal vent metagenome TaxID=652676 RepID=A0A1W1CBD7_9ZZZZ
MTRVIFVIFTLLTLVSGYMTYEGIGLEEVKSIEKERSSVRSSSHSSYRGSSYSGGYSSGK